MSQDPSKKKRRLNYDKCRQCRAAKKKCTPTDRQWPQKCHRCKDEGLECSENQRAAGSPFQPSPSGDASTDISEIHDLSLRVAWVRQLKAYAKSARDIIDSANKLFRQCPTPDAVEEIFSTITGEENSVISDIKFYLHNSPSSERTFVAHSLLTLVLTSDDSHPQSSVSEDIVATTRSIGDLGTALTMQKLLLVKLLPSSRDRCLPEVQKYLEIHGESMQRLKTIRGPNVLQIPPLHNILQLTKGCDAGNLCWIIRDLQHPAGQKDILKRSLLHVALESSNRELEGSSHLFNKSATIIDAFGQSPLHIACSGGFYKTAKKLLEEGADVKLKDGLGKTPLSWAAAAGHEIVVKLLLNKGAEVNSRHWHGMPLYWAVNNGHEAIGKLLVENGAHVNSDSLHHYEPVLLAAKNGHETIVKLILEKADDSDLDFCSPLLCWAAKSGHEGFVKLLLEKGADAILQDDYSEMALELAVYNGHETVVKLILEKIDDRDSDVCGPLLCWVAESGHEGFVKLLLERNIDVNFENEDGETPLYYAAKNGHGGIVKLLRNKGANVDPQDKDSTPLLHWAAMDGLEATVKMLLENDADFHRKDMFGRAPLSYAAEGGYMAVVKLLLDKGADVNCQDRGGTALCLAAWNGHEATVKLLLDRGADVNSKCSSGKTPLMCAVENGHEGVVKLLRNKGADLN